MNRWPSKRVRSISAWALLALTAGGCETLLGLPSGEGTVGDGGAESPDADIDAFADVPDAALDGAVDAATDASMARCNPMAPFGMPVLVDGLNSGVQDSLGWVSEDEKTALLSSRRNGGTNLDVFVATRSSIAMAFGTPTLVPGINTTADESDPIMSNDGLTIFVSQFTSGNWEVTFAKRNTLLENFGALAPAPGISDPGAFDVDLHLLTNGEAYFASNRDTLDGNTEIYHTAWNGSSFATATIVSGSDLQDPAFDVAPVVSDDNLTLFIGSNRAGGVGGDADIFVATRMSSGAAFGPLASVTSLNTAADEYPVSISPDGCVLYFNRGDDIYVATRPL